MFPTKRSVWLVILASGVVLGALILGWIQLKSLDGRITEAGEQMDRMTDRMDLLTEVVEAASARAIRAEENAAAAAEARQQAEQETATARAEARDSAEKARAALEEAEKVRRQREEDLDRLQKALGALVETRRTALGLVMNLGNESIQFGFDSAVLRPENRELLSRIAGVLLTAKGYSIYVYGHTDDVGSEEYNLRLSERRARSVRDYLVEAGLDPSIITTRGYGKSSPRVPGTTAEARATNRRVEIGIVDVALEFQGLARP